MPNSPQGDISNNSSDKDNQVFGTVSAPAALAPNITGTDPEHEKRQPPQLDVSSQASTYCYLISHQRG